MNWKYMKTTKKIGWALLIVFVAMQFYRPEKNISSKDDTKPFLVQTNPPEMVRNTISQACYDCHSNTTVYPWYNNIAPVSYWIAEHVKDGKKHLNFSEWQEYTPKKKNDKLEEIIKVVDDKEMPLGEYTWMHKGAQLTKKQREDVVEWAKQAELQYQ